MKESTCLPLEAVVHHLLQPLARLRLICFQVHVVDQTSHIRQRVQVAKQFLHVVSHVRCAARVLNLEFLLVELADAVHALANVVIVQEGLAGQVSSELEQQNGVALVCLCGNLSVIIVGSLHYN